ncbi:MAG: hypothetical protein IVW57_04355 [Ktedonobacterales bacterium]|nr:hypothetical protein [Ktedonobacterales bacterium]
MLAKPPISIPTAAVFRALAPSECTSGQATADVAQMIRQGEPLPFERLTNSLEPGVLRTYPEVAATRAALLEAGAPLVRLSGSGPTLYAPFRQLAEAAAVHTRARHAGIRVWLCRTVPRAEVAHSRPT